MKKVFLCFILTILVFAANRNAYAIPALQLYIEGSIYDGATETWTNTTPNFILWVLGDTGHYGDIFNVKLVTAYATGESGSITLTPTNATPSYLPSPYDPSVPSSPVYSTHGDGTVPQLNDGSYLPSHDIYGTGTSWDTYSLGNFILRDSKIGDYINTLPTTFPDWGQINAYAINVTGYSWVHFDAFDHYVSGNGRGVRYNYTFAPFSHDAEHVIPEPATLLLLGSGLCGLLVSLRKKKT